MDNSERSLEENFRKRCGFLENINIYESVIQVNPQGEKCQILQIVLPNVLMS
jgi:hypothetical protein